MNKKELAAIEKNSQKKAASNRGPNQKKAAKKRKSNPNLTILIMACAVIVVGIVLFIALSSGSSKPASSNASELGGTLPKLDPSKYSGKANDFTLQDTDGVKHTLSDHGGRLVLLDFTASWCKWCETQSPDVHRLYQKYGNRVQFYSIDVNEDLQTVINYRSKDGAKWPFLLDKDGKISTMYQVRGYPHYILLNKDGTMLTQQSGYSEKFVEDFSAYIDPNID